MNDPITLTTVNIKEAAAAWLMRLWLAALVGLLALIGWLA
jgi:hypothetical protein